MILLRLPYISDLKTLQASTGWKRYHFLSENQPRNLDKYLDFNLTFDRMAVYEPTPRLIPFSTGTGNRLCLWSVASVDVEYCRVLGDLITITCMGGRQYIILAQMESEAVHHCRDLSIWRRGGSWSRGKPTLLTEFPSVPASSGMVLIQAKSNRSG